MSRQDFLQIAEQGITLPIGTDLVLHEKNDPEAVRLDGEALGDVVLEAARRYGSPLAIPLMDLRVEKDAIAQAIGVAEAGIESFHFDQPPDEATIAACEKLIDEQPPPLMRASIGAVARVAEAGGRNTPESPMPVGMCIGPFSLMVKLVAEPIMPVYMAGEGATPEEDEDVAMLMAVLELACRVVVRYIDKQIDAGARAMFVCEPAASTVYLSPTQMAHDPAERPDAFDRCVMAFNRRVIEALDARGCDLILHDCGELGDEMVRRLGAELHPAMLSLGSSRNLWEDVALIPDDVVLYGNLPSKRFSSDATLGPDAIITMARELVEKIRATGQPFILGTECDVLSVEGSEDRLKQRVDALLSAGAAEA